MSDFSEKCSRCLLPIPKLQSSLCSICYGDPDWGTDGYLRARLAWQREEAEAQARQADEAAAMAELEKSYDPGIQQ